MIRKIMRGNVIEKTACIRGKILGLAGTRNLDWRSRYLQVSVLYAVLLGAFKVEKLEKT